MICTIEATLDVEYDEYSLDVDVDGDVVADFDLGYSINVTIMPIPSNYGLITWNGHVLTVS